MKIEVTSKAALNLKCVCGTKKRFTAAGDATDTVIDQIEEDVFKAGWRFYSREKREAGSYPRIYLCPACDARVVELHNGSGDD